MAHVTLRARPRRSPSRLVAISLTAACLIMLAPPEANAYQGYSWQVVNNNSNMCMGVSGGSSVPGTAVVQWPCNGHGDQFWSLQWPYATWLYNLVFNASMNNRCLGLKNGATGNGTPAVSVACNSGNWDQLWLQVSAGNYGYAYGYVLQNKKSGRCLGVPGSSQAQGVQLVIWDCNGHADQVWLQGVESVPA